MKRYFNRESSQPLKSKYYVMILITLFFLALFFLTLLFQIVLPTHQNSIYTPSYPRTDLKPILDKQNITQIDSQILFMQTGLSSSAISHLQSNQNWKTRIIEYQEQFFHQVKTECQPLFGTLVMTEVAKDQSEINQIPPIIDTRPGDILVSFSTHTLGWRHGHSALVIDETKTLESRVIGQNSSYDTIRRWQEYPCFAVLRVKGLTDVQLAQVLSYSVSNLYDIPYRLTGEIFFRSPEQYDHTGFGVNCSSLIWYAYQSAGIELDSNGGPFTTPYDLLSSDQVEIIQIYGINPP